MCSLERAKKPTDDHAWFSPHGADKAVLVKRKVDKQLGEVILFPTFEKYPITVGHDETLDKMRYSKRVFLKGLEVVQKHFQPDIDALTYDLMCPSVRAFSDAFNLLNVFIKNEAMRERFRKMRDLFCLGMQSDDSYRFLMQLYFTVLLDLRRVRLSEPDCFWFRSKNWFDFDRLEEWAKKRQLPK